MRVMRGNLLGRAGATLRADGARAKGLKERTVVYKHAVRIAINPIVSSMGMGLAGHSGGRRRSLPLSWGCPRWARYTPGRPCLRRMSISAAR